MRVAVLSLLLLAASVASAQESCTYAVQGTDTHRGAFRGQLVTRARADLRVDVDLDVTFASGEARRTTGTVGGSGRRLEGRLQGGTGLSGGLTGSASAPGPGFSASFGLLDGSCNGALTFQSSASWFWGSRARREPSGATYEARTPAEKQVDLFREVSAVPYGELPRLGSRGVGESVIDTLNALRLKLLDRTFADASDVRPARTKIFHPFGSVATVAYEARPGHPYTGLYATGGAGLARLSLATDDETFIPGIALKLFVAGKPSVNLHAIPSFEPQTGHDFFERSPSNEIPPPTSAAIKLFSKLAARIADPLRRPVEHLAAVNADGSVVASPVAPRRIFFRPAEVHFPASDSRDFRVALATIPEGAVIYRVCAVSASGEETHIGDVRLRSRLVASEWGDRVLHFKHER